MNFNSAWSPDGRFLACLSNRHLPKALVYVRSLESQEVQELTPDLLTFSGLFVESLEWTPDRRALLMSATTRNERGSHRLDIQTGAVTRIPTNESCMQPVLGPDGKSLFYVSQYSGKDKPCRLLRRDLESGVEQELYQTTELGMLTALSPDGQQMAVL
jgi:Tol biopolymer transport system component